MAHVTIRDPDVELTEPTLVEGLPGVGLVGKIATDHLVDSLGMTYYASVDECEGLPRLAMYGQGDYDVRPPVRIYADEERNLLALQSDVPIPKEAAGSFADCITDWLAERSVTPIFLSGLPADEKATPPELFGIGSGGAGERLSEVGLEPPSEEGIVSGPTGALLSRAAELDRDAMGLVVQSNSRFPDPEAARIILKDGVGQLADVEVPLDELVEKAEDIKNAKEKLAQRMEQASQEESSQAKPLRMYQ